jgi:hypothetical protein
MVVRPLLAEITKLIMETFLKQAEDLVRNHEANKDLQVYHETVSFPESLARIPHLEHYLDVLSEVSSHYTVDARRGVLVIGILDSKIRFHLNTGAPVTEKDAEEFIKLVN